MGGGQQDSPPVDLLGGQYASFTGGTPSGVNWPGFTQDLSHGINQGLQSYARGEPSSLPAAAGSDHISQPFSIPVSGQQQSYPLIPTNASANQMQPGDIMMLLQQLLGGGGYG